MTKRELIESMRDLDLGTAYALIAAIESFDTANPELLEKYGTHTSRLIKAWQDDPTEVKVVIKGSEA